MGDYKDTEGQRLQARLFHNYTRAERIPVGASLGLENATRQGDLLAKMKVLIDAGVEKGDTETAEGLDSKEDGTADGHETDKLQLQHEQQTGSSQKTSTPTGMISMRNAAVSVANHNPGLTTVAADQLTAPVNLEELPVSSKSPVSSHDYQQRTKSIPVYKWGLKFDGKSQSIGAFLQRVEELRRARGVTSIELFDAAVDLFEGPALIWYRSTIGRISNWETLCNDMRIVFQAPDHDIRLQQEIFNRVQGDSESIDLYIAAMESLYSRLALCIPEEVRLKQIFHNLNPQLQDRLALFEVTSIEQLRLLGRKAEAGRFRSTIPRGASRNFGLLEPDLAYEQPLRRRSTPVASMQSTSNKEIRASCWNCGEKGHRHKTCQQEKNKFCYGCGIPNVYRSTCTRCSSYGSRPTGSKTCKLGGQQVKLYCPS